MRTTILMVICLCLLILTAGAQDMTARRLRPVLAELAGMSACKAPALTARGVPTARGGDWNVAQVANVLRRAEAS